MRMTIAPSHVSYRSAPVEVATDNEAAEKYREPRSWKHHQSHKLHEQFAKVTLTAVKEDVEVSQKWASKQTPQICSRFGDSDDRRVMLKWSSTRYSVR